MKSQPLQSVPLRFAPTAHRREKAPIPEWDGGPSGFRIKEPVRERLPTGVSGPIYLSKQVSDTPVVHRSEYPYGMDSSSPVFPAPSSHVRSNIPWPRGQVVFPSSSPSSDGPVFPPQNLGHHRSNVCAFFSFFYSVSLDVYLRPSQLSQLCLGPGKAAVPLHQFGTLSKRGFRDRDPQAQDLVRA